MEHDFIVSLKDIYVEFDGEMILNGINLNIKDKEFVTFLGPSGCGKTTTLRIIGGFLSPNKGDIFFEGAKINDVPPYKRNVNTIFQKYSLFPHLNVYENVAFGLRLKKVPELTIKDRVKEMLSIVDLKGYEKRPVSKLSGGQQQRVAIARALVCDPKVLLLDEPLGALDLKLRKDMQTELKRIQQRLQTTFIYVTHDQEEALTMSDTVVVMNNGSIEQIGTPTDIYNEPANAFVADFIGEANIINGIMLRDYRVLICGAEFSCLDKDFGENQLVDVVIRPEDIDVIPAEKAKLSGRVENAVFKGVHYEMTVNVDGCMWLIHSTTCQQTGSVIGLDFIPDNIHIMKKLFPTQNNIFETVVTYCSEESNSCELKLEKSNVTVSGKCFPEGTRLRVSLPPEGITVAADGNGDLNAYIVSVIYKGSHNEIILETDDRKWIMSCDQDEQVATYVPVCFSFDNADFTVLNNNVEVDGDGV